MKNIGIWLDKKKAKIVTLTKEGETFKKIMSEVEFFNRKSGSKSRIKSGVNQEVVHESSYLEKEKRQLKSYFKKLADTIKDADSLAIFGPAETPEIFRKELMENYKSIGGKVKTVKKMDSMTDNQTKALVKDYFNKK